MIFLLFVLSFNSLHQKRVTCTLQRKESVFTANLSNKKTTQLLIKQDIDILPIISLVFMKFLQPVTSTKTKQYILYKIEIFFHFFLFTSLQNQSFKCCLFARFLLSLYAFVLLFLLSFQLLLNTQIVCFLFIVYTLEICFL